MDAVKDYYKAASSTIMKALVKRGINSFYCATSDEARDKVLSKVKKGSIVSWGGSQTLSQTGIIEQLKKGPFHIIDPAAAGDKKERVEIYRKAFTSDVYFTSTNAITKDGKLVNIDGNGNRLAALMFGPSQVFVICGMNKVTEDEISALKRIRSIASPMNTQRLERKTPCRKTGFCSDCLSEDSICSHTVITRRSHIPGRITVVLIGESLGY